MSAHLRLCGPALAIMMISTPLLAQVTPGTEAQFYPMVAPETQVPNDSPAILVQTQNFQLNAGETRRVFGRVEITSTSNLTPAVEAHIICFGPNGWTTPEGGSSQNYLGQNTPAGPNYPITGHLVLYSLLLLTAPSTGAYMCHEWAQSEVGKPVVAVGRSFQGGNTTWLRVGGASDDGAQMWQDRNCDEWGNVDGNAGPSRTLAGGTNTYPASWCNYLGPKARPEIYVFSNDGSYPSPPVWEAANNAAFVDARDSIMLTVCYQSNSCIAAQRGQPDEGSVVESYLELTQLNGGGGTCNVTSSPVLVSDLDAKTHHNMVYHELLTVPVLPSCGSRKFLLMLFVKWMSGNPAKIDGPGSTRAFAINSFFGTAPPVPDVVGLPESAASNTLSASGYYVSFVSNGHSTTPLGSVIAQYPSAGVVELPGSGVNLTLSNGSVTVPKVIKLKDTEAAQNIIAVGLVPNETLKPGCEDPHIVQTQNPVGGSDATPGSTVSFTANSGKTVSGTPCAPN
jgi:PASTA domain